MRHYFTLRSLARPECSGVSSIPSLRRRDTKLPTIVLLSGACSTLPWCYGPDDGIAGILHRQGRDVVVVGIPGFQEDSDFLHDFNWQIMYDRVAQTLAPLCERNKIQLVGYSLGAFVAIQLASDKRLANHGFRFHDPRVKLTLLNPPFVLRDWQTWLLHRLYQFSGAYRGPPKEKPIQGSWLLHTLLSIRYFFRHGLVPALSMYRRRILKRACLKPELLIDGPLLHESWPAIAVAEYLCQIPQIRRLLRSLDCPVQLLSCNEDCLVAPVKNLEPLVNPQHLSDCRLEEVKEGGHFWLMLNQKKVADLILSAGPA